ncbi:unnamed protein product [Phytophthora fragariaefolia]|uniref:Unnamed protein product n=1 Tax=Phytophthora fragariaefolia TaxID=1490495 RepID=A0A9W7CWK9_9STRA|nr:unnamed protein product [Phytophthora fragariaefolia]
MSALLVLVLLRTHEGSITKTENARFIVDLFVAALGAGEYRDLLPTNKIVIVTDNVPAHSEVENLARQMLVSDDIMNRNRLVLLRLGPYSPIWTPSRGAGTCSSQERVGTWLSENKTS